MVFSAAGAVLGRCTADSMRRTRKVEPLSFSLETEISPPSVLVRSLVIVSPRPRPGMGRTLSASPRWKGS
ncbi:hypothetical protein D3C87_1854290 [compost metagenome]